MSSMKLAARVRKIKSNSKNQSNSLNFAYYISFDETKNSVF